MYLRNIDAQNWIMAMFMRDDGDRLILGAGAYEFSEKQLHFAGNTLANDVVELQGADGQMLAGQVRRSSEQIFTGYIGDGTFTRPQTEEARRRFIGFFATGHLFDVVYISCPEKEDVKNSAIVRRRGYLTTAPEVTELYQVTPEYTVALAFEDVNYYQYAEDPAGNQIYANEQILHQSGTMLGGWVWDEAGAVWDEAGGVWDGTITPETAEVINNGITPCGFLWAVGGHTKNPLLQNLTTGKGILFDGEIAEGSELVIDTARKTAELDGVNVYGQIHGDWPDLAVGANLIKFSAETERPSVIKWDEVLG